MPKRKPSSQQQRARGRPAEEGEATSKSVEFVHRAFLACLTMLITCGSLIPADAPSADGLSVVLAAAFVTLLFAWMLVGYFQRNLVIHAGPVELALAVFLALVVLSAWIMAPSGNVRAAINAVWQWISFAVAFFLARQIYRSAREQRAICVVMIGLAVGLSGYGCYQYQVEFPAMRQTYLNNPASVMRQAGVVADPGSPEAGHFYSRLISTDPFATFVLANSLAGFLLPWLILAVAIGLYGFLKRLRSESNEVETGAKRATSSTTAPAVSAVISNVGRQLFSGQSLAPLGSMFCAAAIAFCLVLTKSRTAWVSVAMGLTLLGIVAIGRALLAKRKQVSAAMPVDKAGPKTVVALWCAILGVAVVLVAAAVRWGGLDKYVISQTVQSFTYRLEYWQATWAMICRYPWFGCGAGCFQDYYPTFKLPQSSETVADPHNFLLEVWATTGSLAFVAWLAMIATLIHQFCRPAHPPRQPAERPASGSRHFMVGGAGAGVVFAVVYNVLYGLGVSFPAVVFALLGIALSSWLFRRWILDGRLERRWLVIALGAAALNLLAAGGVSFPNVALSIWLLAALALNAATPFSEDDSVSSERAREKNGAWKLNQAGGAVMTIAAVGLVFLCLQTAYAPVLNARTKKTEARSATILPQRISLLQDAVHADPYDAEAHAMLVASLFQRWSSSSQTSSTTEWTSFEAAARKLLASRPHSSNGFRQVGDYYFAAFQRTDQSRHVDQAIELYEKACDLHPNSNIARAQLAWAYHVAGQHDLASREAKKSLRLDTALERHPELKLDRQTLFIAGDNPTANAEQLMKQLRRSDTDD